MSRPLHLVTLALTAALLAAALLLLAAACDDGVGAADVEGAWVLTSGTHEGDGIPIVDGHQITLNIEDDTFDGTSACNRYGGDVEIEDGNVRFGNMFGTAMGCEPAAMTSEQAYLGALTAVDAIALDGDTLVISGPGTELRFVERHPIPTADLVRPVWVLDTLIDGDAATTVAGDEATLELRTDGTLSGSTGCRTFTGEYIIRDDEVVATSLTADGECPAELASQDSHVITVIGDGFTATIDGDRLTLSSQGNLGASYRAR